MNTLPTNYVDAVYSGNKKYAMTTNGDGTVSFTDQTSYTTQGTRFGAADVNAINSTVNELAELLEMTWTRDIKCDWDWSSEYENHDEVVLSIPLDNVVSINVSPDHAEYSLIARTYSTMPISLINTGSYVRELVNSFHVVAKDTTFTFQSNEKYFALILKDKPSQYSQYTEVGQTLRITYQAMKLR